MSKLESVKNHLRNNKATYIACGVTAVVVAGTTYYFTRKAPVEALAHIAPKITNAVCWKPTSTIEVYVEALGDPGNIIQDLTTGTIYASQGQAAKALGLSPSEISKHLNGLTNHVKGHQFSKLGKAMVAETAAA